MIKQKKLMHMPISSIIQSHKNQICTTQYQGKVRRKRVDLHIQTSTHECVLHSNPRLACHHYLQSQEAEVK